VQTNTVAVGFNNISYSKSHSSYTPRVQTRRTKKMAARLQSNILVVCSAYFTKFKGGVHFTVQFILFFRDLDESFTCLP